MTETSKNGLKKTNLLKGFIENVLGSIWALWGLVSFFSTFLIIFLPSMGSYLFKDTKKGQDYFIAVSRIWMRIWLYMVGCPVKISGGNYYFLNRFSSANENRCKVFSVKISKSGKKM